MEFQDKNENRDNTISLKVTNDEKELLQQMADETGLSLSDFIRRKAAANEKYFADLINENSKLKDEVKDLRVKLSFGLPKEQEGIIIKLTPEKREVYDALLQQYWVRKVQDDPDSELIPLTTAEKIVFTLDNWLFSPQYFDKGNMIERLEPTIFSAINHDKITIELAKKAFPKNPFLNS